MGFDWASFIVATVLIIILGLLAVTLFYFFSSRKESDKESEAQVQTTQYLKLLTSHSHPEAGEEWVVSFETEGEADLTIIPEDQDSINDLDFVSLSCDGKEKAEEEAPQTLTGDVIFYPNWQCAGRGELVHLVNIARKHTLKFQFSNKMAYAYNNPDSVTDTFDDESKIAATSSVEITGGQAQLAICGDSGDGCSADGDCCSGLHCQNSVCCATGQTCCSSDDPCGADSNINNCQYTNNYCDTVTDHYCKSSTETCGANQATKGATSCTAVTTSNYCQYLNNACDGPCQKRRNYYGCVGSGSTCEGTARAHTDTNCGVAYNCSGGECIAGNCATCYYCDSGSCSWALNSACGAGLYGCPVKGWIGPARSGYYRYKRCINGVCDYHDCDPV